MEHKKELQAQEAIQKLSEALSGPSATRLDFEGGFRYFGEKLVVGETLYRATSALEELFKLNAKVPDSISRKEFEDAFLAEFGDALRDRNRVTGKDLNNFIARLLSRPTVAVSIRRPITGIELTQKERLIELGPFTVFDRDIHKDRFLSGITESHHTFLKGWASQFVIEVTVQVKDNAMATDLADRQFVEFENAIRYLVGTYTDEIAVGVINVHDQRIRQVVLATEDAGSGFGVERVGPYRPLPIDDPYFMTVDGGHAKLWSMMGKPNPSDLSERLLLAVDWIGQALSTAPSADSFLKAAIALEVLFSKDIGLVTPGIAHQFAECSALIVGDTRDSRRDVYETMKRLYKVRCNIAHTGRRHIPAEDVRSLIRLAREVISRLLTNPALGAEATLEDLFQQIEAIKYSGPPLFAGQASAAAQP